VKKAHCELIDLFAPGGTKKSLRTVFSFFLLLEYFLDTGVHIFSTLVLRRFIGKFLQIFLKSASITSFFFWFQSYIIYIYSDYFPFLNPHFSYAYLYLEKSLGLFISVCGLIFGLIQHKLDVGYLYHETINHGSLRNDLANLANNLALNLQNALDDLRLGGNLSNRYFGDAFNPNRPFPVSGAPNNMPPGMWDNLNRMADDWNARNDAGPHNIPDDWARPIPEDWRPENVVPQDPTGVFEELGERADSRRRSDQLAESLGRSRPGAPILGHRPTAHFWDIFPHLPDQADVGNNSNNDNNDNNGNDNNDANPDLTSHQSDPCPERSKK